MIKLIIRFLKWLFKKRKFRLDFSKLDLLDKLK